MPNIHPRPNLHAQHHNLDTLERLVFEDFNGSPYTSKSTIVISGWESIFCNFKLVRRKFEFVDPRGYINIAWLSIQVKQIYSKYLHWVFPSIKFIHFEKVTKIWRNLHTLFEIVLRGLISESFSLWLQTPNMGAKSWPLALST